MRSGGLLAVVVVVVAVGACASRTAPQVPRAVEPAEPPPPPSLCPFGTQQVGAPPPDGLGFHCERSNGIKHGPYAYWFENGQKEEEGTYVHGLPRGLRKVWDEKGILLEQKEFGAPVTICVYDRTSRRAVLIFPFRFRMTGPLNARTPITFDASGRVTLTRLPTGTYTLEWIEDDGWQHRELVVDSVHEQSVVLDVDATGFHPRSMGGPSPCAPR